MANPSSLPAAELPRQSHRQPSGSRHITQRTSV